MACGTRCRFTPWFFIGLGWLPIIVGLLLALGIVIPYITAVLRNDVSAGFPYISDTGTVSPESCIFGQLLNMAAFFGLATIYVRYKQVELYADDYYSPRLQRVNMAGLVMGGLACCGMSVVANFQVENVVTVHFLGAFVLFVPGAIYGFLHSWISYRMQPEHSSVAVCRLRLALSIVIAIFFVLCAVFTAVSLDMTDKKGSKLHWDRGQKGFPEHIVATTSEWIVAIAFLLYFFTFIREFQRIKIEAQVKPHSHEPILNDVDAYARNAQNI